MHVLQVGVITTTDGTSVCAAIVYTTAVGLWHTADRRIHCTANRAVNSCVEQQHLTADRPSSPTLSPTKYSVYDCTSIDIYIVIYTMSAPGHEARYQFVSNISELMIVVSELLRYYLNNIIIQFHILQLYQRSLFIIK